MIRRCVLRNVAADIDDQPVLRGQVLLEARAFVENGLGIEIGLLQAQTEVGLHISDALMARK